MWLTRSYLGYICYSSSRSGSESPSKDKVEFIQEFKIGSPKQNIESGGDYDYYDMDTSPSSSSPLKSATSRSTAITQGSSSTAPRNPSLPSSSQARQGGVDTSKMSLAEKLKYRMRQGLEQSGMDFRTLFCMCVVVFFYFFSGYEKIMQLTF